MNLELWRFPSLPKSKDLPSNSNGERLPCVGVYGATLGLASIISVDLKPLVVGMSVV